jgi:hypothetical protein
MARAAHEAGVEGIEGGQALGADQVGPAVADLHRHELLFRYPDYIDIKKRQLGHVCWAYKVRSGGRLQQLRVG